MAATRILSRSLLSKLTLLSPSPSFTVPLRPIWLRTLSTCDFLSPFSPLAVRGLATRTISSSLNDPNPNYGGEPVIDGDPVPYDPRYPVNMSGPQQGNMMSIYMSRSFPRSNSSFSLCSGNALQSEVSRIKEEMFLVDAGLGTPRICMQDELTGVPINRATRFENKVEFRDLVAGESPIKKRLLERFFMDLVAGEPQIKDRAATRFNALVGSTDVVAGEPHLLLPRRFRQNQAWIELNKIWRTNTRVKGFIVEKVKGGYLVAIAGFITFLPLRRFRRRKGSNDRFTVETINPKRKNIVVF